MSICCFFLNVTLMEDKVLSDYGFSQEEAGCPGGSRDVFETDFVPGGAAAEEKYTL